MKFLPDGTILGAVYERASEDEVWGSRFLYECEHCCYSCSGPDESRVELKADQHEQWHQEQEAQK